MASSLLTISNISKAHLVMTKTTPVPLINLTVPLIPAAYSQQYNEHCSSVTTVDVEIGCRYERYRYAYKHQPG